MRYYLVNEGEEVVLDLAEVRKESPSSVRFEFYTKKDGQKLIVYVRELAGKYFCSPDGLAWGKMAAGKASLEHLAYFNKIFNLHRGFKPSSVSRSDEGALFSKMPGKVVKILHQLGSTVKKGWPLIIIEAMKMENEVKSNRDGKIKSIHVKEGEALDQGVLLLEIED